MDRSGITTVSSKNLAARMGRWSAGHWKTATFSWLAFVAVTFVAGTLVGTTNIDTTTSGPGEAGRMDRILDAGFEAPASESLLVQSQRGSSADAGFIAAIKDATSALEASPEVVDVVSPLEEGSSGMSADGRSALIEFDITGDAEDAGEKIDSINALVDGVQSRHADLYVGLFGDASADQAIQEAFGQDLETAGILSIPVTLVILVIAFGALVAAGIPLLLALTAVAATLGLVSLTSQVLPADPSAPAIVLLVGLAVGVDYSMFYLKREREERAAGRNERAALEAAAATSGRSVLISGLTVMVAMAGMFLTGDKTYASFGLATMMVVAVAMLGSLTVLPALLSRLGDKVDKVRVPFVSRLRRDDGEGRIWGAVIDRVLKHPAVAVVLAGGILVGIALPAVQLRTVQPGPETLPASLPVMQTYERLQAAFPGTEIPAVVVVKAADVTAPAVQNAIEELHGRAIETGRMHEPISVQVNHDATVARVAVPIDGTGTDPASNAALDVLRDDIVPATVGSLDGAEAGVTGQTALTRDFDEQMKSVVPLVFGFVLVFAFLLMLVAFRSLVIAAKAIVLNLLSVGAAYGVLVLVFQKGWGKSFLDFDANVGIDPFLPVLLFVILFGLSMDYHVFILSRIRETYDRGASTDEAIKHGIKTTAGIVTSAAVVMVGVFAIFGALSMMIFKQFGVGLATAILIDATVVRAVLLPASMSLLGELNWYLPRWLEWLPRLEHGGAVGTPDTEPVLPDAAPPAPVVRKVPV
ncbi:MAG TPA: MMPL family transporter [Nocardioidaceae bacterium]|nr:MMPL family transporter [Nocardioidaceae bacterium]